MRNIPFNDIGFIFHLQYFTGMQRAIRKTKAICASESDNAEGKIK